MDLQSLYYEQLIADDWITESQLKTAQEMASRSGRNFWSCLVQLGFLSEEDIFAFFAHECGIAYVKIADYKPHPQVMAVLSDDFCRQHIIFPLFHMQGTLTLACANPLDTTLIDTVSKMTGLAVEPVIASARSIANALDAYFGLPAAVFGIEQLLFKQKPLHGIGFHRESERLGLEVPVSLKINDSSVVLCSSTAVEGLTKNISANGAAVGVESFLYLPRGAAVEMEFKPQQDLMRTGQTIAASGSVLYCNMEKGHRYLLGIRITAIRPESLAVLLERAKKRSS